MYVSVCISNCRVICLLFESTQALSYLTVYGITSATADKFSNKKFTDTFPAEVTMN